MFGRHERPGIASRLFLAVGAVLMALPGFGDTGDDTPEPLKQKLQVHGFLTQAYATASFTGLQPQSDELLIGIPEEGTFDYRALALQFRYEMTSKDIMIVQFSNRSNGINPVDEFEDEIELDWAFYERRISSDVSVKVGRVQIPFGIFNEIRDVGTILPFYRPAFTVYREGGFTSETVDGIVFSTSLWTDRSWSLDFDIYFGDWLGFEDDPSAQGLPPRETRTTDALGVQIWLNTAVPGLRFGFAGQTKDVSGGQEGLTRRPGERQKVEDFMFSLEGSFSKWVIRGEYRTFGPETRIPFPAPLPPLPINPDIDLDLTTYYAQAGWLASERIQVWLQWEAQEFEQQSDLYTRTIAVGDRTDLGISLNYLFSANLVLKAEYHDVGGDSLGFNPVVSPQGFMLAPFTFDRGTGNYSILSLSASF